jgi:DUF1365 family protein
MKKIIVLLLSFFSLIFVPTTLAAGNNFVSVVNPVRGNDFWDLKSQTPETAVLGQITILDKNKLSATWLIRFDALSDKNITEVLKGEPSLFDKGTDCLFLLREPP